MKGKHDNLTWPPEPEEWPQGKHSQPGSLSVRATVAIWLGILLVLGGSLTAIYQWALALYRLSLYDGRPYVNHADDFQQIYSLDTWAVPVCVLSTILLWRHGKRLHRYAVAIVLANLLGAFSFFMMHRMGILVTYDEFIQHWMH